ncbi:MAG: class I SAM-dependent methyltransferase [Cellulosilyticaceae bacterium]
MAYLFKYYAGCYDRFMSHFKLDGNEQIIGCLGAIKDKNILDLGGGTGTLADCLQQLGANVTLIDPSEQMTKIARDKNKKLVVYTKTLGELDKVLPKEVFDVIIIRDALHHMRDAEETIKLCHTYLKEGGELVIWEFDKRRLKTKIIWTFETLCFEKCQMFSPDSLRSLCNPYFEEVGMTFYHEAEMLYQGTKRRGEKS